MTVYFGKELEFVAFYLTFLIFLKFMIVSYISYKVNNLSLEQNSLAGLEIRIFWPDFLVV